MNQAVRTCLGCRRKKNKKELRRFVVDANDLVVWDGKGTAAGRGVYCCEDDECLAAMMRNSRGLAKAFRRDIKGWGKGLQG